MRNDRLSWIILLSAGMLHFANIVLPHTSYARMTTRRKTVAEKNRQKENHLDDETNKVKILAEGDSWFAYPKDGIFFGALANIIEHLSARSNLFVYSIASNGDEAVSMLSGDSKFKLIKLINKHSPDVLLFSGGGNDIVGRYDFNFFLRENANSPNQRLTRIGDAIYLERFNRRLTSIENSYRDLLDFVNDYSKNKDLIVVTHTYDIPVSSPTGTVLLGGALWIDDGESWMYPYLFAKGYADVRDQQFIVTWMMEEFSERIRKISIGHNNFVVVETHQQVQPNEWRNEIHPNSNGFKRVADKIYSEVLLPIYNAKTTKMFIKKIRSIRANGNEALFKEEMKKLLQDLRARNNSVEYLKALGFSDEELSL